MKRFKYALQGLRYTFKDKSIFTHYLIAIFVVIFAYINNFSWYEWSLILISIALVLMAEGFNSLIELIANYLTRDYDSDIKNIKDLAAGIVLLMAIFSVIIGLLVIFHHFGG